MLSQFYPPTVGGEERHVQTLSRELAGRGHAVAVATVWHEGLPEWEDDNGVSVHRIRGTAQRIGAFYSESERRHVPPLPDPELVRGLMRVVAAERPEIVHAHNWLVHSFLPIKRWSGAALVMSLHDFSLVCATKNLMWRDQRVCEGPSLRRCVPCVGVHYGSVKGLPTLAANSAMRGAAGLAVDLFLPVSNATALGNGLRPGVDPYLVVPNFVPDAVGARPRAAFDEDRQVAKYLAGLPDREFLLFVADVRRLKGIGVLLSAYARLTNAPPLVLIGRRCVDTPGTLPDNVLMMESWPHAAVLAAWRRCMFGLLPSIWMEPFGIVALEAMSAGRPFVASRIGGLADVVEDGVTGILATPGDTDGLARAMRRLIDDRALRTAMGAAAVTRLEQFRATAVVPRFEAAYVDVLARRAAQPGGEQRVAAS